MRRMLPAVGLCLCLLPLVKADESANAVYAPLEGVKLGKVPEAVYAQVPGLPTGKGILVLEVAPDSFAAREGIKRFDVLISLGDKTLAGATQVEAAVTLPVSAKKVPVVLFRAGREVTLQMAAVRIVKMSDPTPPKGMLKPGGPPAVAIEAKPLQGNRLTVTLTFFAIGSSKLEHLNCDGSVDDIKKQVKDLGPQKRMPQQVQDLADVALERLRVLNSPTKKK